MRQARVFSSRLSRGEQRVYATVVLYFCVVFAAMLWPIYSFFGQARPIVLGLPFSLFYLALLLVLSFAVLGALYAWESRRGRLDRGHEGDA